MAALSLVSPLRSWRIGVFGGSSISDDAAKLAQAVGRRLALESDLVLVTGGFLSWTHTGAPSVDWSAAAAFRECVGDRVNGRVETILPDPAFDGRDIERFEMGNVVRLTGRGRQRRRFVLVDRVDALVAISGDNATREMIDLAMAIDKPCLVLPFTGGAAQQSWAADHEAIRKWLDLSTEEITWLDGEPPGDPTALENAANRTLAILRRTLGIRCFVIMAYRPAVEAQYREVIKPVLVARGYLPMRADELPLPGDAVAGLRAAIQASDLVVALLDELTQNVSYEIGFAHALGKPIVLVATEPPEKLELPFDIRNEQLCGVRTGGELPMLRAEFERFIAQR